MSNCYDIPYIVLKIRNIYYIWYMFYIHSKCTFFGIFGGEIMFVYGRLKTIFMKPSEIPKEKEKEYFCVGDVPEGV